MKIIRSLSIWFWARKKRQTLNKIAIVVDTSSLLDNREFARLLYVHEVFIPKPAWVQMRRLGTRGPMQTADTEERAYVQKRAGNTTKRMRKMIGGTKGWDIIYSSGTGLVKKIGQRTLKTLRSPAKQALMSILKGRYQWVDFKTITLLDFFGSTDIRVLAAAYHLQEQKKDRTITLLTKDKTMLLVAKDLGLQSVLRLQDL